MKKAIVLTITIAVVAMFAVLFTAAVAYGEEIPSPGALEIDKTFPLDRCGTPEVMAKVKAGVKVVGANSSGTCRLDLTKSGLKNPDCELTAKVLYRESCNWSTPGCSSAVRIETSQSTSSAKVWIPRGHEWQVLRDSRTGPPEYLQVKGVCYEKALDPMRIAEIVDEEHNAIMVCYCHSVNPPDCDCWPAFTE